TARMTKLAVPSNMVSGSIGIDMPVRTMNAAAETIIAKAMGTPRAIRRNMTPIRIRDIGRPSVLRGEKAPGLGQERDGHEREGNGKRSEKQAARKVERTDAVGADNIQNLPGFPCDIGAEECE